MIVFSDDRTVPLSVLSNTVGTLNRYSYDPHGSVTAINGVEVYSYDAFGNQIADNPAYANPFRYCGEYFDQETGLIYLRARYYDSSIGRFISEDPIKDGVNWYVYCGSDPVNAIDPSGLAEYNVNAPFPEFVHDSGFLYDPNAMATQADYDSWDEWNKNAWLAGLNPWWQDSSKMYKNYLSNTGAEQWIDYQRAYDDCEGIRNVIDNEIEIMKDTAKWLYDNNWGTSFNITGTLERITNEGQTINWQRTIGAHWVFGVGEITIDDRNGNATMNVTFYTEDMYNFNPGQADIASGTPDAVNGRFAELGWAKEFKTYGSLTKTVTWQLFTPTTVNNNYRDGGR